jgi:organic radical activating enzyme
MVLTTISLDHIKTSSSSKFYNLIKPYWRKSYKEEERICIENFSEISDSLLQHVSQVIADLDISPYFITVITNQPTTQQFFQNLAEPIRVEFKEGVPTACKDNSQPIYNTDESLCTHVWSGFHVNPDETVRVCCEYEDLITNESNTAFNIRKHTVGEIVNSAYMQRLRQQFRTNGMPDNCKKCAKYEKNGGTSKRVLSKFKLTNLYHNIDWEKDVIEDKELFLGGHLGNLCNLKCRICSEQFSTQIAAEKIQFADHWNLVKQNIKQYLIEGNWKHSGDFFWPKIKDQDFVFSNFEILGGEPLMMQSNLDFMQHLIDTGHSQNCIFEFVTNGTQYPKIFDQADRFKRFWITVSIDDIGPRFEYQRKNAQWSQVSNNIAQFLRQKDISRNMDVSVSITVNIQNVYYLPELLAWLRSRQIHSYFINILQTPEELSIFNLTQSAKKLVLDRLLHNDLDQTDQNKLKSLVTIIQQADVSDGVKFVKYMKELDQVRQEKFPDHHQEIALAMGYQV